MGSTQRFCVMFWTIPGSNIPQNCSCKAIYLLSQKPNQIRRTRYARHCWRNKDEIIRDVILWTPIRGRASVGRKARIYLHQLWERTEKVWKTHWEQLIIGTDREKERGISVLSALSDYIYIYIYIMRVLVVSKSLCGYVLNQVQYNMECAQYLW